MESGSLMGGREDNRLLLHEDALKRTSTGDISLEIPGRTSTHWQASNLGAPTIILVFECLESLAVFGISTNLVIYLCNILHESNSTIATSITTWAGTSFITPLLGALIADSYWGSYRMIMFSSLTSLVGMTIITVSASMPSLKPPPCHGNYCLPATEAQKLIFYSGLYLIAFGSGGIKSSLLPLGAAQFNDDNPGDRHEKGLFFSWFYFCINVGALASSTVLVWIQQFVDWAIGYGIATLCMVLAIGTFLYGTSSYRLREPGGSPLTKVFQVSVACFRKLELRVPTDSRMLYEVRDNDVNTDGIRRLAHTDEFRLLDKAAIVSDMDTKEDVMASPWRLCTITQVEEVKILLRLFPIWCTSIFFSVAYSQMYTTFVEQARAMDTKIGSFSIPPASLFAFEVLSVMLWVLLYDKAVAVLARSWLGNAYGLTQLQRMGIGYFLIIITMATAALVEEKRLEGVNARRPLSIMWQSPQYFLVAGSEVFTYIGQLQFFYEQGPDTMKSMSTAVSLLTISLGNYLSSLVVSIVAALTTKGGGPGWIPDNLNEGHLDYFFCWLAGLSILNFIAYLACASRYTLKTVL